MGQLREAVFDLHPYVLEQAGLDAALRSIAQQVATRSHLDLRIDLHAGGRHPQEQLAFSAARELLANVARHAEATHVRVALAEDRGLLELVVKDDGTGFPPERLAQRLAAGHIGLASQRVRIEAVGGTMDVTSSPDDGTRVVVRLPARTAAPLEAAGPVGA